jgi:cytochrome c oxidase subunit II
MNGLGIDPYERGWMIASGVMLTVFLLAVGVSVYRGISLPGHEARIDPARTLTDPPFAKPAVFERGPGRYDAYIRAQIWAFTPNEIKVPAGSTVTFYLTSPDLQHGFMIERTNVNVMVLPGQVSRISARFDSPGEYLFVCHEYCGIGHHLMSGKVIVTPKP